MKKVLIAEKPEQAEKYAKALGLKKFNNNYIGKMPNGIDNLTIINFLGHIIKLSYPEKYDDKYKRFDLNNLPFFPEQFKKEIDNRKLYSNAKKELDSADEIIIGTDIDTEGELIAYEVIQYSKNINKPIKRLWINDTTEKEIVKGMNNLKDKEFSYKNFRQARTRQISDYLVGFNLTPNYTLKLQNKTHQSDLFSIGRVQVPTVWLIKNREDIIKNWDYKEYKKIEIEVIKNGKKVVFKNKDKFYDDNEFKDFMTNNHFEEVETLKINDIKKEVKTTKPPKLFSMGGLRKEANKIYGYTPKKVDNLLQKTHLNDWLTYPRTEVNVIPDERYNILKNQFDELAKLANYNKEINEPSEIKRFVNNKQAREHTAIVPTEKTPDFNTMDQDVKNIYKLSLNRTLMMFSGDYKYNQTLNTINIGSASYINTQNITTDNGWKDLKIKQEKDKEEVSFDENELIDDFQIKVIKGRDQPPAHLTENSLTDDNGEMNKYNLGKPSTQTEILSKLLKVNYIKIVKDENKKEYLDLTSKGNLLCSITKETVLSNPEWTGKWEAALEKVGNGTMPETKFIESIKGFIQKTLNSDLPITDDEISTYSEKINSEKSLGICPICKNGEVLKENPKLNKCNKCGFIIWTNFIGKKLTDNEMKQIIKNGKTTKKVKLKSKAGKTFEQYVILNAAEKKLDLPKFETKK